MNITYSHPIMEIVTSAIQCPVCHTYNEVDDNGLFPQYCHRCKNEFIFKNGETVTISAKIEYK